MEELSRRNFVKLAGTVFVGAALSQIGAAGSALAQASVVGSVKVTDGNAVGSSVSS